MGLHAETLNKDDYIGQGGLGRHETFTPRYGWLKKGFDAVQRDGGVFKAEDSIVRLGVGKNMVSSIRFWGSAFKLIDSNQDGSMVATSLGDRLLSDNGWDPFLEDTASLWLLHWQLFIPPLHAVTWPLAFNHCNLWGFDIKQLGKVLSNAAQKYQRLAAVSEVSFERDASCIIRMYADVPPEKETEIECPFTQLGIIRRLERRNLFSFDTVEKPDLPPLVFAAACFSYLESYVPPSQKTITLQRLTYDFNSPGVAFKVPESAAGSYLHRALKDFEGASLVNVMGNLQLHIDGEAGDLYWRALEKYYMEP